MNYILFNSKSNNGQADIVVREIEGLLEGDIVKMSVFDIKEYKELFSKINSDDEITLIGGDGTLNHFVNDIKGLDLPCKVYFSPAGTGNDFLNDIKDQINNYKRFLINDYIKDLPVATINGKEYLFLNGIGFGIDGYCCEVGDKYRAKSSKPVNYTLIAIKGLLFFFKRPNAKIIVDGNVREFKKVWLAPTMKGRFYGGGMMIAPLQDRNNSDRSVSTCVLYKGGKLKTLMIFPSIFKGEHTKHTKLYESISGHEIEVIFDRPTSLQVDGETILGVTSYKVKA